MSAPINLQPYFSIEELGKAFEQLEKDKRDKFKPHIVKIPMGADGVDYADFRKNFQRNIREISVAVLKGNYIFYPLLEIDVPKDKRDIAKGTRTLSIARIRDLLVQKQLYKALYNRVDNLFQVKSLNDVTFAYRHDKSAHDAIRGIWRDLHKGFVYALDADLCQFFDTLNHVYLLRQVDSLFNPASVERKLLWRYIKTRSVKYSDHKHLKKGEREHFFKKHKPPNPQARTKGVPQGGVLSGMLANLYLYEFDNWVVNDLGKRFVLRYYRYADDFVILTRTEADAQEIYTLVRHKLMEFCLQIHPLNSGKTRIVHIPVDKLDFLGFRITNEHIQVKPKNIIRFKQCFRESVMRLGRHKTTSPERLIAELVKYYVNPKILGPVDNCAKCNRPIRRYNWISFFAPVITDERQLHALDVWMRQELERYCFRRFNVKVRNRQHLAIHQMGSLLKEYWRFKKKHFCNCDVEVISEEIDIGSDSEIT